MEHFADMGTEEEQRRFGDLIAQLRVMLRDVQSRRGLLVLTCLAGTPEQIDAAAYALVHALRDAEDREPGALARELVAKGLMEPPGTVVAPACCDAPALEDGLCRNCGEECHPDACDACLLTTFAACGGEE